MSAAAEMAKAFAEAARDAKIVGAVVRRVVFRVERESKLMFNAYPKRPVKSGTLRRSVAGVVLSPTRGVIGTNLVYGPWIHTGKRTDPRALNGARIGAGKASAYVIYATAGPRPFLDDGLKNSQDFIKDEAKRIGLDIQTRLGT